MIPSNSNVIRGIIYQCIHYSADIGDSLGIRQSVPFRIRVESARLRCCSRQQEERRQYGCIPSHDSFLPYQLIFKSIEGICSQVPLTLTRSTFPAPSRRRLWLFDLLFLAYVRYIVHIEVYNWAVLLVASRPPWLLASLSVFLYRGDEWLHSWDVSDILKLLRISTTIININPDNININWEDP